MMLERSGDVHSMTVRRSNGRQVYLDGYRWAHALPLCDADEALTVDWCELVTTHEAGKVLYRNSSKGYRFEHNFGYGKQHLSATLASLIVLAYLLQTVLDWLDERFRRLRELIACRQRVFDDMRALSTYCHFPSGSAMIEFMILGLTDGPRPPPAPS